MPTVIVLEGGEPAAEFELPDGGSLADACDENDAPIPFSCRSANCGTCRIRVLEGSDLIEAADDDELDVLDMFGSPPPEYRLACQAKLVSGDGVVRVEPADDE